jgi:fumarate reductase subunit D
MPTRQQAFEAIDWLLFSAGGMISAFLLPAHILVALVMAPLGLSEAVPPGLVGAPTLIPPILVRLYLFIVLGGAAWHALHRIRFMLMGLGLAHHRSLVTAVVLLVLAVILAITFDRLFFPPSHILL